MSPSTLHKTLLAAGALSIIGTAQAAELRVNGFASVVGGKTISDEPLKTSGVLNGDDSFYNLNPVYTTGGGGPTDINDSASYDDDISFKPETNIGLQLSADLGDGLSFTAQLTALGANDFDADVEWIYVSYAVNDQLTLSAGRQRLPLYMYSDFLDVGYAYHWLRAPIDLYGDAASTYEGASARYTFYMGDWDSSFQAYYGANDIDSSPFGDQNLDDLWGTIFSTTYDWLQLRASYHTAESYLQLSEIVDATGKFTEDNKGEFDFISFGFMANWGSYFVGGEWTSLTSDDAVTSAGPQIGFDERISYMVTGGYRFGKFTPHITYTERTTTFADDTGLNLAGLDDQDQVGESWIVGVRYDFHPSAALKIEYTDRSDESDDIIITLNGKAQEVSTIAVGVDVIF